MAGFAKRILVVEDNETVRQSLEILLNRAGYYVMLARNRAEAVPLWREWGGDLVIADLFMPDEDGIETILEVRAHTPEVRIIAMSGGGFDRTEVDLLHDAKLLGAVLTIEKPFTPGEMLALVERALSGAG